jgi:UDP-glucose 4-epimerase
MNILVVGAESFIANHFCEKIKNESNYKLIKTSKKKKKKIHSIKSFKSK